MLVSCYWNARGILIYMLPLLTMPMLMLMLLSLAYCQPRRQPRTPRRCVPARPMAQGSSRRGWVATPAIGLVHALRLARRLWGAGLASPAQRQRLLIFFRR